jgi:hypothetical protein
VRKDNDLDHIERPLYTSYTGFTGRNHRYLSMTSSLDFRFALALYRDTRFRERVRVGVACCFQEGAKSCLAERFAAVDEMGDGMRIKARTVPPKR